MPRPLRPTAMKPIPAALAVAFGLTLAGCGDSGTTEKPREGLHLSDELLNRAATGVARELVECTTLGGSGSNDQEIYSEGATSGSPDAALRTARGEGGYGGVQEDLVLAKQWTDRALYVVEVDGLIKQAVIVHDGPASEGAGGPGWYVQSWAACDDSELPEEFTKSIGHQIWTDADGKPVPTETIESWTGPEHCDWQSMTFLYLGKANYVRNPQDLLPEYFDEKFQTSVSVPADAVDSGFQRKGDRLWISADKKRAYVGSQDDAELWPVVNKPLGCD